MKKLHAQEDLSGWLSPDEERLLSLYRDGSDEEQNAWLYRLTRRRLAHMFVESLDEERDARDGSYLHEELEQWLREIRPMHLLGDFLIEEPHFTTLICTAWGEAGRVLLGSSQHDGQRADELFNSAVRLWDAIGNGPRHRQPLKLDRSAALVFLEEWRETALAFAYREQEDEV